MIPKTAHLIWIGNKLPFAYGLAVRSAALRGGFDRVILHHTEPIERTPWWDSVFGLPNVELREVDVGQLVDRLGRDYAPLESGYRQLRYRANQADILRTALLTLDGGVYLDTDVVVVKTLEPLFEAGMFLGRNRSIYNFRTVNTRNPLRWSGQRLRSLLRRAIAASPRGDRIFHVLRWLYPAHPNIAIWGSRPRHPVLIATLHEMVDVLTSRDIASQDYNFIGPFVAQRVLANYRGADLVIHPPEVFYPLGPVLASRWFQRGRKVDLERVLAPATRIVHWYASNEVANEVAAMTPEYIRDNAHRQLYSALAWPLVEPMLTTLASR